MLRADHHEVHAGGGQRVHHATPARLPNQSAQRDTIGLQLGPQPIDAHGITSSAKRVIRNRCYRAIILSDVDACIAHWRASTLARKITEPALDESIGWRHDSVKSQVVGAACQIQSRTATTKVR